MLKEKQLRLDYFHVCCIINEKDENGNDRAVEKFLNLDDAFTDSAQYTVAERELNNTAGERIRVQKLVKHIHKTLKDVYENPYGYWELEILKERFTSLPGVAKPDGSYDLIEVAEGERICEDVTALFDPQTCIMVIFRKREALSPKGIADVLNLMYRNRNIFFRPIINEATLNDIKNKKYFKSIDVSVIDNPGNEVNPLTDALKEGREIQAQTIHVYYGMGKGKSKKGVVKALLPQKAFELISKYSKAPGIQKLVVKAQDDEDKEVQTYDLIEERVHDIIKLFVDRKHPVTHERVFEEMQISYFKNLQQ